ncbi:putative glucose-6-phosphate 1-epimerase [compost metagenome]
MLGIDSSGDSVRAEFTLPASQGDLPGWPHIVELKLTIVMGEQLSITLSSYNLDNVPVTLSQALHSYFAVSDVRQVQVEGVDGLSYIETLANWEQRQQQGALGFAGETDRIYLQAPEQLSIVDPAWNRRVVITAKGSRTAVIWNPWTERAAELPDMAEDGWQRMLCIETANVVDDLVTLAPGATHSLSLTIGSQAL